MSNNIECPICMDDIEMTKNCVTTECGHCFHASCLMRNSALNGFSCPCCRAVMAEEEEDEEEYQEEVSEVSDDDEEQEEMFNERALRGFRFFFNNLSGVRHRREDIEMEQEEEQERNSKPNAAFIVNKLVEQGITLEHFVKAFLKDHEKYDEEEEEFMRMDDDLFEKINIIVSNYIPEQVDVIMPVVAVASEATEQEDPKDYPNVTVRRRVMMHV